MQFRQQSRIKKKSCNCLILNLEGGGLHLALLFIEEMDICRECEHLKRFHENRKAFLISIKNSASLDHGLCLVLQLSSGHLYET